MMKMMMTAEEFQESDVIFSDEYDSSSSSSGGCGRNDFSFNFRDHKTKSKKQRKRQKSGSVPIHIPRNVTICSSSSSDDSDEDEQVLPPHLIVAKRIEQGMAFSVKGGYGRPLKGRELSEVRNSILRMTGFLET